MRVTPLNEIYPSATTVDIHFTSRESAERFSNYHMSLTGMQFRFISSNAFVFSTRRAGVNVSEYPFTADNYVDKEIVESFLKLFPEENEN